MGGNGAGLIVYTALYGRVRDGRTFFLSLGRPRGEEEEEGRKMGKRFWYLV